MFTEVEEVKHLEYSCRRAAFNQALTLNNHPYNNHASTSLISYPPFPIPPKNAPETLSTSDSETNPLSTNAVARPKKLMFKSALF
jgi:hypothetical protein